MDFNKVTQLTNQPPEDWKKIIDISLYEKYPQERKNYYSPLYAKYRTKKFREYDECGYFLGWQPQSVGVGNPIAYEYCGVILGKAVDAILTSNVLMTRLLSKELLK